MNLKTYVDEYKQMVAAFRAKISKDGQPLVQGLFDEIFANNPTLVAVRWAQYTPYFNDGDACHFTLHQVYLKFSSDVEPNQEDGDIEDEDDGFVAYWSGPRSNLTLQIDNILYGVKEALEIILGDHVEVTVARDGLVEVEEFDHD